MRRALPPAPESPLDRLLAQLAADEGVPALANWARRLLGGETASSPVANAERDDVEERMPLG